jgi:transcription elongation factor GreA
MDEPRFRRNPGDEPTAILTQEAYDRLRAELEHLRTEGREQTAARLLHARELGDISENAEFDAAKNEQGLMEARIRELERLLKDPDIVEGPVSGDEAGPEMLVTLRPVDETDPEDETYLLAATKEERMDGVRTVSVDSPLGMAIFGKREGDRVSYEAPGGTFTYEIVGLRPRS